MARKPHAGSRLVTYSRNLRVSKQQVVDLFKLDIVEKRPFRSSSENDDLEGQIERKSDRERDTGWWNVNKNVRVDDRYAVKHLVFGTNHTTILYPG